MDWLPFSFPSALSRFLFLYLSAIKLFSWFRVSHGESLHFPAVVAVHMFLSVRALPSPPESWELMPTLWQCRDGGSGLSRIDVS